MTRAQLNLVLLLLLLVTAGPLAADAPSLAQVQAIMPQTQAIAEVEEIPGVVAVTGQDGALGYAYTTGSLAPISAYSGKPVNTLVGVNTEGVVSGVKILDHQEPILVIGVSQADLDDFTHQFVGKRIDDRIRVGAQGREGYVGIDGITGATITTMVITSSINKASAQLAPLFSTQAGNGPGGATGPAAAGDQLDWTVLWLERSLELWVLSLALLLLLVILFFQDWLVRHNALFHRVRVAYLLFTVFFIGFYCSAQLSVINLLAFFHSLASGFSWDTLLIEPLIFVLWAFVAVSILLWGRGVYCGWLCPFGAAQDLISKLANRLGFEGYRLPNMLHERLWAIKYFILIALVGLSLDSMVTAAKLAEVEPFKTTFILRFDRSPVFVAYAVGLLALSALNSKFYCKYLCPLGAGLSFVTGFRVFDWLRRRSECGKPCESCEHQCQIAAIKPTGEINDRECHYCLECQVTYWDEYRCPPMVEQRKKRERRAAKAAPQVIAVDS
ncbi:4Fe-4S binding protein [Seongchinamella sediminis]|uniref:4Fe-4S binding protein n=1 Tax=Seongchinamella sediminis TaxID=2283635 RepID=A0A3L7DTP2_9GAMM|nr:4Fe-4S binding protein [Seongchinamella sediminis]RLQ20456.1 4Fe-4S binding protein [Seongchinamella sediminis]